MMLNQKCFIFIIAVISRSLVSAEENNATTPPPIDEVYTSAPRFYPNGKPQPLDQPSLDGELKDPQPGHEEPGNMPPPNMKIYDSEGNTVQTYFFHTTTPKPYTPMPSMEPTKISPPPPSPPPEASQTPPPIDSNQLEEMVKSMMAKMSQQQSQSQKMQSFQSQSDPLSMQGSFGAPPAPQTLQTVQKYELPAGSPLAQQLLMSHQPQQTQLPLAPMAPLQQQPMFPIQQQMSSYGSQLPMFGQQPQQNLLRQQPLFQNMPQAAPPIMQQPISQSAPNQQAIKNQLLLQLIKANPAAGMQLIKQNPALLPQLLAAQQSGGSVNSAGNSQYQVMQLPPGSNMPAGVESSQMTVNGNQVGQVVGVVETEVPVKDKKEPEKPPLPTKPPGTPEPADLAPDESETRSPADYEAQMFADKLSEVQSVPEGDPTAAPSLENSEFLEQVVNGYARDRPQPTSKPRRWRKPHLLVKAAIRKLPPSKLERAKWLRDPPPDYCLSPIIVHDECPEAQSRQKPARRWSYQLEDGTCYLYEDPCPEPSKRNSFEQLSQCIASCWRQLPER